MMVWLSRYMCYRWMVVPQTPHQFGNVWHTICCDMCVVLLFMAIIEGKVCPLEVTVPENNYAGKTNGTLLYMITLTKGFGTALVLDSGFCVLLVVCALKSRSVYADVHIKKWRYWPNTKSVPGDTIVYDFEEKQVGGYMFLPGICKNVPFCVYCMKYIKYVSMIISTWAMEKEVEDHGTTESEIGMTTQQHLSTLMIKIWFKNTSFHR